MRSMSHEQKSPRDARLAEIRRRIAAGTYDTPLRLEAALEAFLESTDARGVSEAELPAERRPARDYRSR
ncbi:MAG: hypothetical protein KF708_24420 [Pirellulales bacterium]|nr:hypothetical protein [Pirellulales bacterium]